MFFCEFCEASLQVNNQIVITCNCEESLRQEFVQKQKRQIWAQKRRNAINKSRKKKNLEKRRKKI